MPSKLLKSLVSNRMIDAFPETEQSFFIDGPAGHIETIAAPAAEKVRDKLIVICHPHPLHGGTMNNKVVTTLFRAFRHLGFDVIRFNYRGVGQSQGEFGNTVGETDDLMAVIQWAQSVKPGQGLWLAGFSFGSIVAAKAAKQSNCQQLISLAPPVHHYDFASLSPMSCPWLVIQPEADEVVPPQAVYDWHDTTQGVELIRLPEASHFFHGKLIALRDIISEHLG